MRNLPGPGNTPEDFTAVTQQPGTLCLRKSAGRANRKLLYLIQVPNLSLSPTEMQMKQILNNK